MRKSVGYKKKSNPQRKKKGGGARNCWVTNTGGTHHTEST